MDEMELDDWFASQREAIEEQAYAAFAERKQDPQNVRDRFNARYRDLLVQYQRKQNQLFEQQRRSERLHAPFARMSASWNGWKQRMGAYAQRRKSEIRKMFIDWRFRRMIRNWRPS